MLQFSQTVLIELSTNGLKYGLAKQGKANILDCERSYQSLNEFYSGENH